MNNSFRRMHLIWVSAIVLCKIASSQSTAISSPTTATLTSHNFRHNEYPNRIKWTWQLPHNIRKAFNQSRFCDWYVEKMISYNDGGKTMYAFYLNNSSCLDGDHFDCFLQKSKLIMSDDGAIVGNNNSE